MASFRGLLRCYRCLPPQRQEPRLFSASRESASSKAEGAPVQRSPLGSCWQRKTQRLAIVERTHDAPMHCSPQRRQRAARATRQIASL